MIDHTTYPDRVREALAGTTPGEWEASPYTGRVMRCRKPHEDLTVGLQIVATAESDADAALIAESPTLAAAYLDAADQLARVRRILAVEQGDEAAAPGWKYEAVYDEEYHYLIEIRWTRGVMRVVGTPYEGWDLMRGVKRVAGFEAAYEAMESADAAQEPTP